MPRPDRIMERNNNHNQYNGSGGNGFLLGVIVGVLLTLLFTTKRGRAVLKDVLEKGVEKFSNLEELLRMSQEEDLDEEFEEDDDYIPAEPVQIQPAASEKKEVIKKNEEKVVPQQPKKEPEAKITETQETVDAASQKPEIPQEEKPPQKPKTTSGKRWFRGLRKKS